MVEGHWQENQTMTAAQVTSPEKGVKIRFVKISLVLKARGKVLRNVDIPAIRIEAPMVRSISTVFSLRLPGDSK
jgi:hypothetical protein